MISPDAPVTRACTRAARLVLSARTAQRLRSRAQASTLRTGRADSNQLCLRFSPLAAGLLALTLPLIEPAAVTSILRPPGHTPPDTESLAAAAPKFVATPMAVATILLSAALGMLVTLSTFLVIGATNALTYNVVGHIKTVGVIVGGVLLYDDVCCLPSTLFRAQCDLTSLCDFCRHCDAARLLCTCCRSRPCLLPLRTSAHVHKMHASTAALLFKRGRSQLR